MKLSDFKPDLIWNWKRDCFGIIFIGNSFKMVVIACLKIILKAYYIHHCTSRRVVLYCSLAKFSFIQEQNFCFTEVLFTHQDFDPQPLEWPIDTEWNLFICYAITKMYFINTSTVLYSLIISVWMQQLRRNHPRNIAVIFQHLRTLWKFSLSTWNLERSHLKPH